MPNLLGVTNPTPGLDNTNNGIPNKNLPPSSNSNPNIQNVTDPNRVVGPDGKTERQDSGTLDNSGQIRYDSNFQTFLQRLREAPSLAAELARVFSSREGTVALSGMGEGTAAEIARALEMMKMDRAQLLDFLSGQMKSGVRFGGPLFALLRNAYARAASDGVRLDILQFVKNYADYSSTSHIEGNILRNLRNMADAMPASWAEKLRDLTAMLENSVAAGDRQGALALLQKSIFPYMSSYVSRTHDMGLPRSLLSLLALDAARYENGAEENLLDSFRRLSGYGTLKGQLGGVDGQALLAILRRSQPAPESRANQFAEALASAAARALRGGGSADEQQVFQQLVNAMLVNESVYMPVNHLLIPIEMNGRMLFSELWVDPEAEDDEKPAKGGRRQTAMRFLFKMDVQSLGFFDILLTARGTETDVRIACPERVAPFAKQVEQAMADILTRNGLTPTAVSVRRMERPIALTEAFPKIFEGKNSVNVKA